MTISFLSIWKWEIKLFRAMLCMPLAILNLFRTKTLETILQHAKWLILHAQKGQTDATSVSCSFALLKIRFQDWVALALSYHKSFATLLSIRYSIVAHRVTVRDWQSHSILPVQHSLTRRWFPMEFTEEWDAFADTEKIPYGIRRRNDLLRVSFFIHAERMTSACLILHSHASHSLYPRLILNPIH